MNEATPTTDHDLLIRLNEKVENLNLTVASYASASSTSTTDHENRIRLLETANSELKGAQKSQARTQAIIATVGGVIGTVLAVMQFIN